jgi:aminoglycoside phosphotransferase (APT) family kinase protein
LKATAGDDEGQRGAERGPGAGLAAFLSKEWGTAVEVESLSFASAGARRRNLLFDALRGGERIPLVATIIPSAAVQIMPIEVEAAHLRFAEAAGMPAPHVFAVCVDASFVGGPFFVTERVAGETIPRQVLRLVAQDPALGPRLARQCGEALARLHAADPARADARIARPAGDPMEDLGWLCQRMWRFRNDALEVGGFGARADLAAGYAAAGGRFEPERFHWWKTMSTLRWGLGLAGQAKAHLDGSVPSIVMAASGRRVAELEWDVLMLLRRSFEE